jgi:hypothetical protein
MPVNPVANQPVSRPDSSNSPAAGTAQRIAAGKVTSTDPIADLVSIASADGKPVDSRILAAQKKQSGATKIAAALQVFMGGVKSIFEGSNRLPSTQSSDQNSTTQSAVRDLLRKLNIKV